MGGYMNNKWLSIILFSGIFSLIGFIFFLIGLLMFRHINKKEKRCILKTYGIVKDVVKHKSYNSDSVKGSGYYPVFEYHVGDVTITKESAYGSGKPRYKKGQNVEIYYNPQKCSEYYIKDDKLPHILAKVFTIVGAVLIGIAFISAVLIFILYK